MQHKGFTKSLLALTFCFMLIAAISVSAITFAEALPQTTAPVEITVLGEGETAFLFSVVDDEQVETQFEIHTDAETVGAALLEVGLIAGDEGAYGLYVKTVNGLTADWDTSGHYWAFYIGGEYASTGVDSTPIEPGQVYQFKYE